MSADPSGIERHRCDLDNVFLFARVVDTGSDHVKDIGRANLAYALKRCREHIGNRIPASSSPGAVVARFIRSREWAQNPDVSALWAEYLEAGFIGCDTPCPSRAPSSSSTMTMTCPAMSSLLRRQSSTGTSTASAH
jgi:hypothetical protein